MIVSQRASSNALHIRILPNIQLYKNTQSNPSLRVAFSFICQHMYTKTRHRKDPIYFQLSSAHYTHLGTANADVSSTFPPQNAKSGRINILFVPKLKKDYYLCKTYDSTRHYRVERDLWRGGCGYVTIRQ